ncbi:YrhB domain-containing protein [Bradyrhizobium cajani]|uniref:YrhB domain-containing protein n=1 Tax=Bradyrhizobium cajani TaxID=1928661 RepID=UPI001FEB2CB3|nr:YrhB domain-containing protein [Bradyrhizobium cajani]MCP3368029.1 YrhB family protein [Bradyrhizobium cajani]
MDFEKAAALATAWVELTSEGSARIQRELTVAKPYGWIFFHQSKEFLDGGDFTAQLVGNVPFIVDRDTLELRITGSSAMPLEYHLAEYERTLLLRPFNARRNLRHGNRDDRYRIIAALDRFWPGGEVRLGCEMVC